MTQETPPHGPSRLGTPDPGQDRRSHLPTAHWVSTLVCALVAALGVLMGVLAAPSPAGAEPARTRALTVTYCIDCVPFEFQDDSGAPAGVIIDTWRLFAEKTGATLDFVAAPWGQTLDLIGSGAVDLHAGLFYTEERDRYLDYGTALLETDTHVFFHDSLAPTSDLAALAAYRIGVLKGDTVEQFLRDQAPGAILTWYPDYAALMTDLQRGTIRVFAADTPTALYHLDAAGLRNRFVHTVQSPLYTSSWFVAAREGDDAALTLVNQGMARITNQERQQIARRWISGSDQEIADDALIIAIDRADAPYTFLTPRGQPAGLLVDLWTAWSEKTGRAVRFRPLPSPTQIIDSLRSGTADISAGMTLDRAEATGLVASDQIYRRALRLFRRTDSAQTQGARRLGMVSDPQRLASLERLFPGAVLTAYPTANALVDALMTGDIDAALHDDRAMEALVQDLGLQGLITPGPRRLLATPVVAALPQGHPGLLKDVNAGLAQLMAADRTAIETRWIIDPRDRFFGRGLTDAAIGLTPEERAWLTEHPSLRLGVDRGWAPYEYIDAEGRHQGLSAAMIGRIEEILGISFLPPPTLPWAEVMERARNHRLDVLPALVPTEERQTAFAFTTPYLVWPTVIATRPQDPQPESLADIAGKRLAVVEGYAIQDMVARDHPDITLVPQPDIATALSALDRGWVDAVMDSPAALMSVAAQQEMAPPSLSPPTPYTLDLAIGVRKDWAPLAVILNKALARIPTAERQRLAREAGLTETLAVALASTATRTGEDALLSAQEIALLAAAALGALALVGLLARGVGRQQRPVLQSLNAKSILFLVGAFLVVGAATLWGFGLIGDHIATRLGRMIAERHVLWHKERVQGAVARELALARQMADSQVLKRWATAETDPEAIALARTELQSFHDAFRAKTIFVALAESGHFYYSDEKDAAVDMTLRDTLSPEDEDDRWYFATLADPAPYNLNVDHNTSLGVTNLWINHVMRGDGVPLGVVGTGVHLSEFITDFITQGASGVSAMVIDEGGAIQAHRDPERIAQNVIGDTAPDSAGVWEMLGSDADRQALRDKMAAVQKSGEAETLLVTLDGAPALVGLAYLEPLNWFTLAVFDSGRMIGLQERLALAAVFAGGLLITAVAFVLGQNLLIVRPLLRLTDGARRLSAGDYAVRLETSQRDEIGDLTRSFSDMAATIARSTEELRTKIAEIERFNRLAVGREGRIAELKAEINVLCREVGRALPFATPDAPETEAEEAEDSLPVPSDGTHDADIAIADLLDVPQLQSLMDSFCASVGVASAIIDTHGTVLIAAAWQRACTDFHRVNEETCARCIESDTDLALNLEQGKPFSLYRCRNGLTDAASPIIIEGQHLANVFIGQFFLEPPDLGVFAAQARRFGFPEDAYLQAIREVPVVPEAKLPVIMAFLVGFAQLVAAQSIERRRRARVAQDLHRGHVAAMSLAEDAEAARAQLSAYKDQLEDLVEERTKRLQSIIDTAVDGIIVINDAGTIQSFSPAATTIFGYEPEEVIGRNVSILGPHGANGEARHTKALDAYKSGGTSGVVGTTQQVTGRRKDGTTFPMDLAVGEAWLNNERFFTGIARDITERRAAEDKLARAEEQNRLILGSVADGIFGTDTEGHLIFANNQALEMLGYEPGTLTGQELHALLHHSHADGAPYPLETCPMWAAYTRGESARVDDEVLWRADGSSLPVEYTAAPMLRDGGIIGAVIAFRDITERKEAERRIRESDQKIRRIFETASEGIWMLDLDQRITEVNEAICAILDRPQADILGQPLFDFVDPDQRETLADYFAHRETGLSDAFELSLSRPDGSLVHCLCNAAPLLGADDQPLGSFAMLTDITLRKQAEIKLAEAYDVIASSIEYASRIQRSLLPDTEMLDTLVPAHFVIWEPRDKVGGDAYWCARWGRGTMLALGDCTGHGVPGAFMTMIANGAIEMALLESPPGDPAILLQRIHQLIQTVLGQNRTIGESNDGLDLGVCYLAPRRDHLVFAGARLSLFQMTDGTVTEIRGDKQGLGYRGLPGSLTFTNHRIEDLDGLTFYMTSDGLVDQVGGPRRRGFGKKRFSALLTDIADRPLEAQREAITAALAEHQGAESRRDDVSVLGFRAALDPPSDA